MCGIAGILNTTGAQVDTSVLTQMCDTLRHRGPDDEGFYFAGPVGLGQRRLSIIDLSGGRQPMSNEDGSVWITFNGEIYNFRELREELQKQGHQFATSSDTEVILHGYEQGGPDYVQRLRGMFAFALWDEKRQQLLLGRDRVGKKPLFYADLGNSFVFGSELQALAQHPQLQREIEPAALDDYLTYGYVPAPKTIYKGVYKLPPGHLLTLPLTDPRPKLQRYWSLEYTPKLALSETEAAERLLAELSEAVRLRMIADVPVGALLSGGVDSSVVVALMSRFSSQPVKTFSVGFEEQAFNELPFARAVAERYNTEHHELIVRPNALEVLPTLVRHYGEPYGDSSAVPSYYVSRLTREHVKVVLNGDGGDECFAGYERHRGSAMADSYQQLPRLLRRQLIEPLSQLIPDSAPRRSRLIQAKRFMRAASEPFTPRYQRWNTVFNAQQKQNLYKADLWDQLDGYQGADWFAQQFAEVQQPGMDHLDTLLAVEVRSYLPYDLLVKMDIATMANSLEARSPFLDHELMEFAAQLPSHFKLNNFTMKYLLKKVAGDLLPAANIHRRKAGFAAPVGRWLSKEMRPMLEDALLAPTSSINRYLQPSALKQLVQAHTSGQADNSIPLWTLLCLELWHREFLPL